MSKPTCELFCRSNEWRLQGLYTGFELLHQQRKIELSYHITRKQPGDVPAFNELDLLVRLNGTKWLLFDMRDRGVINESIAGPMDFYFKRSFSPESVGPDLAYKKVFPAGLAFRVYEKYPSWFDLERITLEELPRRMASALAATMLAPINPVHPRLFRLNMDNGHLRPDPTLAPGVIFMTRVWDPSKTFPEHRAGYEAVNSMRAACIRGLRKEFGPRFVGGLHHDPYARRYFADCLIPDAHLSALGNYMDLLRRYPIAVTSLGLHNSTGLKFAEYLAFSRAIVSERLHFVTPGLEAATHYLDFTTADSCVNAVSILMSDMGLRTTMMEKSQAYYDEYLRPDQLVWHALSTALEGSGGIRYVDTSYAA